MRTILGEEFYSFEDIAQMLNVSISTVSRMIRANNCHTVIVDHKRHIGRTNLLRCLTEGGIRVIKK